MSFLRDEYVFGVVNSRRLGNSLGINVLPLHKKVCNFNCIYCECGLNDDDINRMSEPVIAKISRDFPDKDAIASELSIILPEIQHAKFPLDVITFSGNGEPTLNPKFDEIVDCVIAVRNATAPNVKIAVLSNATTLHNPGVLKALKKIDKPILKLDSATDSTMEIINLHKIKNNSNKETGSKLTVSAIVAGLQQFEGNFIMQVMFLRGTVDNIAVDNTTDKEVKALLEVIKEVSPQKVMIYPIDRQPPVNKLVKIPAAELQQIAKKIRKVGAEVQVVE